MTTTRQLKQQEQEQNARANKRIAQLEIDVNTLREEIAVLTRIVDAMTAEEEVEEEVTTEVPKLEELVKAKPTAPKKSTK